LAAFYEKSGLANEQNEVQERIIALDPEHPLAKKAKVEEVVVDGGGLPSLESSEKRPESPPAETVPPVTLPEPPEAADVPQDIPEDVPVAEEVTAVPTAEFEVELPDVDAPPVATLTPPPAPPAPVQEERTPEPEPEPEPITATPDRSDTMPDAAPTIIFENPPIHEEPVLVETPEATAETDNDMTLEFDMTAAARTAPPVPKTPATDPRADQMGPIKSTIITSNSVVHEDELITSEFEISDSQIQSLAEAEQEANWDEEKTLMDHQIPDIQMESEFEIQMVDPPTATEVQQGELLEFDFFLEAGLLNEAQSVLDELRKQYGDHPDVISRGDLLEAMQNKES